MSRRLAAAFAQVDLPPAERERKMAEVPGAISLPARELHPQWRREVEHGGWTHGLPDCQQAVDPGEATEVTEAAATGAMGGCELQSERKAAAARSATFLDFDAGSRKGARGWHRAGRALPRERRVRLLTMMQATAN
ncbi:unnamed protein product [Urochloa humidicola]